MAYDATIRGQEPRAVLSLRGGKAEIAAVLELAELPLPARPNTAAESDGAIVAWVGEDHWIVLALLKREEALSARLRSGHVATVVLSDAYASFAITGTEAADILAQASPLDICPEAFPPDGASFTELFGQKGLLIRRGDGFECLVDSSYADYIADCLSRCHARIA